MHKRTPITGGNTVNGKTPPLLQDAPIEHAVDLRAVSLTATFLVPADWRLESQTSKIRRLVHKLNEGGCLVIFDLAFAGSPTANPPGKLCRICGWMHDTDFTQIKKDGVDAISLSGRLPDIVRVVHKAHEKGFNGLSTKDGELLETCGGYRHPCKVFDDLKHRADYKRLFDTSLRGYISIRGAVGISRNKSESDSE